MAKAEKGTFVVLAILLISNALFTGVIPGLFVFLLAQAGVISFLYVPVIYLLPFYIIVFPLVKYLILRFIPKQLEGHKENAFMVRASLWIYSSSAFIYPVFASIGLYILNAFEKLFGMSLYSKADKMLLVLLLGAYLVIAGALDAACVSKVRYESWKRGLARLLLVIVGTGALMFLMSWYVLTVGAGL